MEFIDEETVGYAFLLGSALRNQDTDQFIDIYDTIPNKLQVEVIKDTALLISDLPEEEYSDLVVQAREFSLAKSSLALALLNNNNIPQRPESVHSVETVASSAASDLHYMDMEQDIHRSTAELIKPTIRSLMRTSRHLSTYPPKSGDPQEDNDSGVFNTSKNTTGSVSDQDLTETNESRGCFDYYLEDGSPSDSFFTNTVSFHSSRDTFNRAVSTKEQERLNDRAYDDSFDADSDNEHPSQSNCFDQPTEYEMKTFKSKGIEHDLDEEGKMSDFDKILHNESVRQRNNDEYDESLSFDSDHSADLQSVVIDQCTPHQILYSKGTRGYASMNDSDLNDDSYGDLHSKSSHTTRSGGSNVSSERDKLQFTSSPNYGATRQYKSTATMNVDAGISFSPLRSRSTSSEGVKISETVKRRDTGGPPFGDPLRSGELFSTAERLIDGKGTRSDAVPNMPRASPISNRGQLELGGAHSLDDGDKKKKKKKKKDTRDDDVEDENGNPLDTYRGVSTSSDRFSNFPRDFSHFNNLMPGRDQEDTMSPAHDPQQGKKRRRKRKEEVTIKSQTIPGYMGNKSLEELLSIIDGGKVPPSTSQKRPPQPSSVTNNHCYQPTMDLMTVTDDLHQPDDHLNNIQSKTDAKSKKKKKNKHGSKPSSEVDDRSSKASELDSERAKDTFSEGSFTNDLITNTTSISSSKASSVGDDPLSNIVGPFLNSEPYIFTDFDQMSPKEETFTVVSKIKKKKKTREFVATDMACDYRKDDASRRRSRPPPRSYTPPPVNTTSACKQDRTNERALSPSAFPVLGKGREARRNSTGNLAELERYEDSDLESVKSVPPASHPDKPGEDISAAGYKPPSISYATITAGGRGSSQNDSASSQDGDQVSIINGHVTLHTASETSILGNGVNSAEDGSISASVGDSQMKCILGFVSDSVARATGSRPSSASSSNANCAKMELSQPASAGQLVSNNVGAVTNNNSIIKTSSNSCHTAPEHAVDGVVSGASNNVANSGPNPVVGTKLTETEHKVGPLNVNNAMDFPALSQTVPAGHHPHQPPSTGKSGTCSQSNYPDSVSPVIVASPQPDSQPCALQLSTTIDHSSQSPSVCDRPKGLVTKPPTAPTRNNTLQSKTKTSKSVIFMDRRMNDQPSNLGISFGFEPDLENNVMISARLDSSSTCSSDSGRGTDSDSVIQTVMMDKGNNNSRLVESVPVSSDNRTPNKPCVISDNHGVVPCDNSTTPSFNLTTGPLLDNQGQSQLVFIGPERADFKNPVTFTAEEMHKFKVVAPPPNGIVIPAPIGYINTAQPAPRDIMLDKNRINSNATNQPHTTAQPTPQHTPNNTCAEPAPESLGVQGEQSEKLLQYDRSKDPNFQAGNFNHEAGVAFLYADWQRIQNSALKYEDVTGATAC